MYKIDDYVVYNHDVCKVIGFNSFNSRDYYILNSSLDSSLKINVPVDSNKIRSLITKNGIENLIKEIPSIDVVSVDKKNIDITYKKLIDDGSFESLISIIKTAYLINKERIDSNKKIRDKDNHYFSLAEQYLYNEFSVVLNMSFDETKRYVINEVEKLV